MQTLPALAGSGLPAHRRDAAAPALEAKAPATRRACRHALARLDAHLADSGQSPATCSLAIAAVTSAPSHFDARALRTATGRSQAHGVSPCEMARTLAMLGRGPDRVRTAAPHPTLAAWLRDAAPGRYVVCSRRHWLAVAVEAPRRGQWADNRNRTPRPLATAPMRMRVTDAIRIGTGAGLLPGEHP